MKYGLDDSVLVDDVEGLNSKLLFRLEDKPPIWQASLTAFQHFLAIFVSIMTAPLLVCIGMGLGPAETNFIISSSLFVSGIGTIIQVVRFGPIGAKLLCIQGTSFTFIGALILASASLQDRYDIHQTLGILFGSAAAGGLTVMLASLFLTKLKTILTPTVTGVAVVLLGISLVSAMFANLTREYQQTVAANHSTTPFFIMSIGVVLIILLFTRSKSPWLRLSAISIGLGVGYLFALLTGQVNFAPLAELPLVFIPQVFNYPFGFDWGVFFILLPVYFVTVAESIGDITATSTLSRQPINTPSYWQRVRCGVMADGFNSVIASIFSSFPSTTFSQNNGVIRLTGVASRYVGLYVALFLILASMFPILGGLFQVMPGALLFGALGLMFALICVSGFQIIKSSSNNVRSWSIATATIFTALSLSHFAMGIDTLSPQVAIFLQTPIATGIVIAVLLEKFTPQSTNQIAY